MLVQTFQKVKKKRAKNNKVPNAVMAIIKERSGGICEDCNRARAKDPHHIRLKSQGGLDIPINILYVCRPCHTHDTDFLNKADAILRERIDELFFSINYHFVDIAVLLDMDYYEVRRQTNKKFLKYKFTVAYGNSSSKEDIQRWLTGGTW